MCFFSKRGFVILSIIYNAAAFPAHAADGKPSAPCRGAQPVDIVNGLKTALPLAYAPEKKLRASLNSLEKMETSFMTSFWTTLRTQASAAPETIGEVLDTVGRSFAIAKNGLSEKLAAEGMTATLEVWSASRGEKKDAGGQRHVFLDISEKTMTKGLSKSPHIQSLLVRKDTLFDSGFDISVRIEKGYVFTLGTIVTGATRNIGDATMGSPAADFAGREHTAPSSALTVAATPLPSPCFAGK